MLSLSLSLSLHGKGDKWIARNIYFFLLLPLAFAGAGQRKRSPDFEDRINGMGSLWETVADGWAMATSCGMERSKPSPIGQVGCCRKHSALSLLYTSL